MKKLTILAAAFLLMSAVACKDGSEPTPDGDSQDPSGEVADNNNNGGSNGTGGQVIQNTGVDNSKPVKTSQAKQFSDDEYRKALWMTTRFYGAQRMGKQCNNWLLWDYKGNKLPSQYLHGDSYIKDADGSYDLSGGWFDCGDYVLFGQTFYYSVYTLLLGYSEFPTGYGDYYSQDYKEYTSQGKYLWTTSKSGNKIPDIIDECKWATDFC
ncbi:MAG: glycoside hydrolase family 9 protein, partial [Bacteroidales bacterium]|nr:glycoside hydrolase family 9 protein [Bacteroidales bacterium]